jgi:hypothetical protein
MTPAERGKRENTHQNEMKETDSLAGGSGKRTCEQVPFA